MKKTLVALALTALPAVMLSACNGSATGGTGVAPLPNAPASQHGRMRRNDNGPQDLHAGGADIPAIAFNLGNQPVGYYNQTQQPPGQGSLFYAAPTTGTIYYCLTSSTDGRKAFYGSGDSGFPPTGPCAPLGAAATGFGGRQDPLDFVASATALTSAEYTTYKSVREQGSVQWGEPFEFPVLGGSIGYGYRPQDFKSVSKSIVKLSTWTYCAIANGTIGDWNDAAITADNGKSVTGGNSEPITFYFRSDSAGTTNNFTNVLNTVCNVSFAAPYNAPPYGSSSRSAAWSYGVNSTWPGPGSANFPNANFIGEAGDPGILAAIQATPYGTGYIASQYTKFANPKVLEAWFQNGFTNKKHTKPAFVNPGNALALAASFKSLNASSITYGEGSDLNPLGTTSPWCILFINPSNYVTPPAKAWPVVDVTYMLFYGQNNGVHVSDKTKLINFLESKSARTIVNKLRYAVLSTSIQTAVLNALNGNGGSQPACLQ